ncbi:MAG TPA: hypothetical protein VFB79_13315 [Candidatus Angelobacter sp.]|nr:hypothetical protein [Candidatus Angelobacter sp.]
MAENPPLQGSAMTKGRRKSIVQHIDLAVVKKAAAGFFVGQ